MSADAVSTPALPRLLPCGDAAISVEFGEAIDPDLNTRVLALQAALADAPVPGVIETVPTYRALLVQFDPLATDVDHLVAAILAACRDPAGAQRTVRRWRVPVVYGGDFGIDLETLAAHHGMTPEEVVRRHSGGLYRVYMIGFMPGFAYLGGLDPALATPRRLEPRLETPAQSVSVGGAQAAISSVAAPSGWHLLGRTPARAFMPGRDPVFLYEAGDEVVFEPIVAARWDALDAAAGRGEPVAELLAP
ncbi:5-oxoprolinase subunit PxpB [uncultured Alsobacter sp.]|uniref:5-oxoprolinase subunit PxpB n=1 Tax=uncultured Alsobacter sp. TaxID=1748258 RepID=UPI0025CD73CF|nr:5-oxoprolinase subunit PxpB [uncultured Alsobacter sp.]